MAATDVEGSGTAHDPWILTTPPGQSEFEAYRDPHADPPVLVVQVGSTVRLVSTLAPKRTITLKVTEASPPNLMVWSDRKPLGLFTGMRTFRLTATAGGTDFAMTETFSGLLAGLITKAIPDMTESFEQYAVGLKSAAEGPL